MSLSSGKERTKGALEDVLTGLVGHHWKERAIGFANYICPSTGECQGQKGWLEEWLGRVWGTFGIALEI